MAAFHERSIATQVRWALGVLVLLTTLGSFGMLMLARNSARNATRVYRDRLQPIQQLMVVTESYSVNITFALRAVRGGRMAPEQGMRILDESEARAWEAWGRYAAGRPESPVIQEAEASLWRLRGLHRQLDSLLPLGISRELGSFGDAVWLPEVVNLTRHLQALREQEDLQAAATVRALEARSRETLVMGLGILASILALTLWYGHRFSLHLRQQVERLLGHLRRVADGDLEPVPVGAGEGELARAERELNRTVARLDQHMTLLRQSEEALTLSEARAQEATRAKSAFLASMSHELRTPLSAILGYSRLMARDTGRSEQDRFQLDQVLVAGEHLLSLINDVLSLSKIEAGRMDLRPCTFSLADLVRDMESIFGLSALSKGLTFEVDGGSLPPQVEGDLSKLRQVLVNLLGNALKFTNRGSIRLLLRWRGDRCLFRVEDTGPGISEEDQARLFQPFQQTPLGASAGGTGLGLHISRALVALLGGTLELESALGQGAAFQFEIPLAPTDSALQLPAQGQVLRLGEGEAGRKILIVDDRPENRDLLSRLLTLVGFRCCLAEDGAAGLRCWREEAPDLVLMDLRMPVMDGFEAVKRLRALEQGTRTPVVAISASVYDVTAEDLAQRGFDGFLTKPIDENLLFECLERRLGLHFQRQAPPAPAPSAGLEGLGALSPPWRAAFQDRVASGDLEAAEAMLPEVADPRLAEAVRGALRAYRIDDLLKHLA